MSDRRRGEGECNRNGIFTDHSSLQIPSLWIARFSALSYLRKIEGLRTYRLKLTQLSPGTCKGVSGKPSYTMQDANHSTSSLI